MSQIYKAPTAGSLPPTVLETITGNTGGPESASNNNFNIITANSTLKFAGSAATETLDFGFSNLLLGTPATHITGAARNVGMGQDVLGNLTSGSDNVAFGAGGTGVFLTSGSNNTLIGGLAGENIATGSNNTLLGKTAGTAYTTSESDNIAINNHGVVGDSAITRIGTQGTITKAFVAGISGVTAAGAPVAISSTGQLSSLGFGTSGQVLTSNGAGTSPTFQAAGGGNAAGFSAYLSANIANVTGDGTNYAIPFNTTSLDTASAFNTSTGVYTFPYSGLWMITGSYFLYNLGPAHGQLYGSIILTAGSQNTYIANPYNMSAVGSTELQVPFTVLVNVSSGDTAYLDFEVAGGTKTVGAGGGSGGMSFSGALINM